MMDTDVAQMVESAKSESSASEQIQLVVFELDDEEYAVLITDIREIVNVPQITPVPNAEDYVKGILNLRGKIVVVVDMEKRFKLTREEVKEPEHIIIAEVGESVFGLCVDRVTEVISVPKTSVRPAPTLASAKIDTAYLKGVVVLGGNVKVEEKEFEQSEKLANRGKEDDSRLLIYLDLPKMLSIEELSKVRAMADEESKPKKEEHADKSSTT